MRGGAKNRIRHSVVVDLPPEAAFARFTERIGEWWPAEYTWSGDVLQEIGIEARAGGMCFERGPHGFWCDWGRVLELVPPRELSFTWQIGPSLEPVPDERRASEVEVHFEAVSDRSRRVDLEHRGLGAAVRTDGPTPRRLRRSRAGRTSLGALRTSWTQPD
jgi:uncharacterized protein YndB with AHSA1/START domain